MFVIIKDNKVIGSSEQKLLNKTVNIDFEYLFINKQNYLIKNKEDFFLKISIFSESVIINAIKYELKEQIKEENIPFIEVNKTNKEEKKSVVESYEDKFSVIDKEVFPEFIEKNSEFTDETGKKEEIKEKEFVPSFIEEEEIKKEGKKNKLSFIEESVFIETGKEKKIEKIEKSFEKVLEEDEEIELELIGEDKEVEKILNKDSKALREIINKELKDAREEMGLIDDIEMLNELWIDLLKQIETEKKNFYKGIKDINYNLLHKTAHKLKGAALNLRISSFATVLKYIDELSKGREDIIVIKRYVDNFYQLLNKFKLSEKFNFNENNINLSKSKILFLIKFLENCSDKKIKNNLDFLSKFLILDKDLIDNCDKLKKLIKN